MRSRWILALSLAVAVPLLIVPAAQADRKPSAKERSAVAAVVKLPPECASVRISTVTKKPKWASVTFKPAGSECEPFASNGVTVAKRKGKAGARRWRFVTAGSSFACPDLYKHVPVAIAEDLGIDCTPIR